MEYFTDLIDRSYIYYKKDNKAEIAQYYFEAQSKSEYLKLDFYSELISTIDSLIEKINIKAINLRNELSMLSKEDLDNYNYNHSEEETYKENQLNDLQRWYDDSGIDYTLKQPNPNPVKSKSDLIYLIEEATRAKNAKSIDELDTATSDLPVENEVSNTPLDIKKMVSDAFAFTLTKKVSIRKDKQSLSNEDFEKLVKWVTLYFEKDFELPPIDKPILRINTAKGNIIPAFRYLYDYILSDFYHKESTEREDSLYSLIKSCFYQYRNDKISNMKKEGETKYFENLIKKP